MTPHRRETESCRQDGQVSHCPMRTSGSRPIHCCKLLREAVLRECVGHSVLAFGFSVTLRPSLSPIHNVRPQQEISHVCRSV
jgi:hypothetical protein